MAYGSQNEVVLLRLVAHEIGTWSLESMDRARADRFFAELRHEEVSGWTVLDMLGNGKSAVVFRAEKQGKSCALKIFDPELVERFGEDVQLERVRRELLLKGHDHEGLIQIIDGGRCESTDLIYVAMEYLGDGWRTLSESIEDIERSEIPSIICQVAMAAEFLEKKGLVHRDIKPDNIMIHSSSSRAVLMDLGVLKPIGASTITDADGRQFVGTLQYSPPEFLFREETDCVDDWRGINFYQIGAVMHDLIMRRRIFSDYVSPYARLVDAVQHVAPSVKASDVDQYTIELCEYCLIKNPEVRLRLVSWSSFGKFGRPDPNGETSVKDRVRRRRLAKSEPDRPITKQQLQRRKDELHRSGSEQLESTIRALSANSDDFPDIEIYGERQSKGYWQFILLFSPSTRHALDRYIGVLFRVSILDMNSAIYQIDSRISVSSKKLTLKEAIAGELAQLYTGSLDSVSMVDSVEGWLYRAMDEGQRT